MLTSLCNQLHCFNSAQINIIHCVTLIASPTASRFVLNAFHSLLDCPQCLNNLPKGNLWFRVSRASIGAFCGMDTLLWFLSILTHFHHLRCLAITILCPISEFCAHCLIQCILTYLLVISYWFHRSACSCIWSAHMQHSPSPPLCLCTDLSHHIVSLAVSACLGINWCFLVTLQSFSRCFGCCVYAYACLTWPWHFRVSLAPLCMILFFYLVSLPCLSHFGGFWHIFSCSRVDRITLHVFPCAWCIQVVPGPFWLVRAQSCISSW